MVHYKKLSSEQKKARSKRRVSMLHALEYLIALLLINNLKPKTFPGGGYRHTDTMYGDHVVHAVCKGRYPRLIAIHCSPPQ